jgi:hypothetical protein
MNPSSRPRRIRVDSPAGAALQALGAMALAAACLALVVAPAHAAKQEPRAGRSAKAHVYPTLDRVTYVFGCMRDHPGNQNEMISKCSCTIDEIAKALTFDQYTSMSTAVNAISIGGERGGTMRDSEAVQAMAKRYRDVQVKAKKACFVIPP